MIVGVIDISPIIEYQALRSPARPAQRVDIALAVIAIRQKKNSALIGGDKRL